MPFRFLTLTVSAVVGGLIAPAAAWPIASPFGEPEPLALGGHLEATRVAAAAMEPDGRQTIVFQHWSAVWVTRGTGSSQFLGNGYPADDLPDLALAVGPDDSRLVAWVDGDGDGAFAATAAPGGRFGRAFRLGPVGSAHVAAAVEDDGTEVVAWMFTRGTTMSATNSLLVRVRPPGGAWSAPQTVEGPEPVAGVDAVGAPALRALPGGGAVMVWRSGTGRRLAILTAGAAQFGVPEEVPVTNLGGSPPVVIGLPDGSVLTATANDAYVRRAPDGTWDAAQRYPPGDDLATVAIRDGAPAPVVVPNDYGVQSVAWADGTRQRVQFWQIGTSDLASTPVAVFGGEADVLDQPGLLDGPRILENEAAVLLPGSAPGRLTIYAAHARRLWALDDPAPPDVRPPGIVLSRPHGGVREPGLAPHAESFGSIDEAASLLIIRAAVLVHGAWRPARILRSYGTTGVLPSFRRFAFTFALPTRHGRCLRPRVRAVVSVTEIDHATRHGTTSRAATVRCLDRRV